MFAINHKKNELLINEEIKDKEIRLIDADGAMLGIVELSKGLELADEKELDLIQISGNVVPPICKIADYNKMIYEQEKKKKEAKKNQKIVALKEVRLSVKIEEHDLQLKGRNAYKFLSDGNKVKASIRFKGRQQKYKEDGIAVLEGFAEMIKEVGEIEKAPTLDGRSMIMIIAPKKGEKI